MQTTRFPFRQVFFSVPSMSIMIISVILLQIPLFQTLGYEFSFALNLAALPLSGFFIISLRKKDVAITSALVAWFYVLCIPLLLSLANALFVKNCDIREGILFYTLNVIIGNILGGLIAFHLHKRLKSPYIAWIIILIFSILYRLYQLYIGPSISFYDHLWGFYSGAIYDEIVSVDQKIQVFRITTMALISLLFIFSTGYKSSKIIIFCLIVTVSWLIFKGYDFPLYHTYKQIRENLSQIAETKQYQIIYSDQNTDEMILLAKDHAFRVYQLQQWFEDKHFDPFTTYVYDSSDQKAALMGARGTQITFPWRNEVHIQRSEFPHQVLKHEIAHVLAGKYSPSSLLHVPSKNFIPQMAIIEGLAVAAAWDSNDYDPHTWSKALLDLNILPKLEDILTPDGFLYSEASLAYTVAGSFIRYLKDTYGILKIRELYHSSDFENTFKKSLVSLESDWIKMIQTLPVNSNLIALAKEYFSEKSIFEKVCPHEIAKHSNWGWEAFEQHRFRKAYYHFEQCANYDHGNPKHLLDLLYTTSMAGAWEKSLSLAKEILSHPNVSVLDIFRTNMVLGDMYFFTNNFQWAKKHYHLASQLSNYPSNQAIALIKYHVLKEPVPSIMMIKDFILPKFSFTSTITNNSQTDSDNSTETSSTTFDSTIPLLEKEFSPIINASTGYYLFSRQNYISAISYLENALNQQNSFDDVRITSYLTKLLIQSYYFTQRYKQAQTAIVSLIQSNDTDTLIISWAKDWNDRIEFEKKEGLILENE